MSDPGTMVPRRRTATQDRWLAVGAWWSFLVLGPLGGPFLLAYTWRDRGSLARRHAVAATVVQTMAVLCVLPLLDQLMSGLDATSRREVERGVTTTPSNVFDHTTRLAWIVAIGGFTIGLACTIAGTIVALASSRDEPA